MNEATRFMVTGTIVTMDAARRILDRGAMVVADGRIVDLGSEQEIAIRHPRIHRISVPDAIVIPGLIDAHTHVTQALVRGLIAHELPMIYRLYLPVTTTMQPCEAAVAARLCMSQLLRSGVTTVCEGSIGASEDEVDAIIEVAFETGIRCNIHRANGDQDFHHAALYSQVTDKSSIRVRRGAAEKDLEKTSALLRKYEPKSEGRITASVCASGITNFSEDYFREAARLARAHRSQLHIHAARDREEVEFCLGLHGKRPIEFLDQLGVLDSRAVLAHAMLATESEMVVMGRARCGVAHSAVECINILNAIPNIKMMKSLGVTVGLGCDNAINDMFEVMRAAWTIHGSTRGIQNYDPEILTADEILAMATVDAARLLGLEHVTGSLEIGKAADFVILDGSAPHLFPIQHIVPELVRYATRSEVRHVFVAGAAVVWERELKTVDLERLKVEASRYAKRAYDVASPRRYRSLCCG